MKRTWIEQYAGESFLMKVVKFGKWKVEFGMDVKRFPHGWDFKNIFRRFGDFYYHGHIGGIWYSDIEVSTVWNHDAFFFLSRIYDDWLKSSKKKDVGRSKK